MRWDEAFVYFLLAGVAMWFVQIVATAVSLADLVVVPLSVSVTRTVAGRDELVSVVFFLAAVCLAFPRLLETCVEVAAHDRPEPAPFRRTARRPSTGIGAEVMCPTGQTTNMERKCGKSVERERSGNAR